MKYIISDTSVVPITETSGTIQVVTQGAMIEISDTQNFTDSLILSSINTRTFEKKLYIRAYGEFAQPIEVNVANFNIGTGGGGISSSERVDIETALKAVKVVGNTVCFYTSTDTSITPAYSYDYPEEIFLDQAGTTLVKNFVYSGLLYPNTLDPNLNGKTVLVLAVKGDATTPTVKYSFVDVSTLIDVYTPADNSIDITNKAIKVNLSTDTSNALTTTPNGLLSKLYSSIGDNTDGAMTQAAIKSYVEQELDKTDWQLDGNIYRYGKVYKSTNPLFEIGGVDVSKISFTTSPKRVTIPSAAYNSATRISLVSDNYWTYFDSDSVNGGFSVSNSGKRLIISCDLSDDFISNTGDNVTISYGDGNNTISNSGNDVRIYGNSGNDSFSNSGDNVSIYSGDGNNTISNSGNDVRIYGNSGNDSFSNSGDNVSIYSGDGNNTISNSGNNITINTSLGAGDNFMDNIGERVSIYSGGGNDTIINTGASVRASLQGGDNSVTNTGEKVSINAGLGNDSIDNSGERFSFYSNGGNDTITNSGDYVSVGGGSGNDFIDNSGDNVTINASLGSNEINNTGENVFIVTNSDTAINSTAKNYYISVVGGGVSVANDKNSIAINGGNGDNYINNSGDYVSINGGNGNDSITNTGDNAVVSLGGGNDSFYNSGDYASINATVGSNRIANRGEYVAILASSATTINNTAQNYYISIVGGGVSVANDKNRVALYGDSSNDTLANTGDFVFIQTGNGNNFVSNNGDNVFVVIGSGNDTVSLGGENTHVTLQFSGDISEGLNSVYGFDQTNHIIKITNSDTSISSSAINGGDDTRLVLTKGSANTTVDFYGIIDSENINFIYGEHNIFNDISNVIISGSQKNDSITNTGDFVFIFSQQSNDTIENSGTDVTIDAGAGKDLIKNTGSKVEYIFDTVSSTNTIEGWTSDSTIYLKNMTSAPTVKNLYLNADGSEMTLKGGNNVIILKAASGTTFTKDQAVKILYGANQTSMDLNPGYRQLANGTSDNHAEAILDATSAGMSVKATSYSYSDITVKSGAKQLLLDLNNSDYNKIDIVKEEGNSPANISEAIKISSPGGADTITNAVDFVSISSGNYKDIITNSGKNVTIRSGAGSDEIVNDVDGSNVIIDGGNGNDTITNKATKVLIDGGESVGADVIINEATATEVSIYGSGGKDSITNKATEVSIYGGDDADSITNSGSVSVLIDGGAGNDTITNSGNNVTINAGKNADLISITGGNNIEYLFEKGFGSDTITGYDYSKNGVIHFVDYSDSSQIVTAVNSDYSQVTIAVADDTVNKVILNGPFTDDDGNVIVAPSQIKVKVQVNNNEVTVYNLGG